jgi:signal transduction histidine kinase
LKLFRQTNASNTEPSKFVTSSKWSFAQLHGSMTAWVILGMSVVVTIIAYLISTEWVTQASKSRFLFKAEDIHTAIRKRMNEQEAALWGGVGLFNASQQVTREEWRVYVKSLRLQKYLPGLQGYGFAEIVRHADKETHVQRIRNEGFPNFKIYPPGKRDVYSSITYLEPFQDRNLRAFGYDMFSESTRLEALQRARDTGEVSVSGKVTLVQETGSDVQVGFLMYLPVYNQSLPTTTIEEKRLALIGYVYSPFRIKDLMRGILGKGDRDLDFRVYDGAIKDRLLYDSSDKYIHTLVTQDYQFITTRLLTIGGRTWLLEFRSKPGFISQGEKKQPLLVAAGGILIDILLFLTISSLSSQRKRAHELALRMTDELRFAKEKAEVGEKNEMTLRVLEQETNIKLNTANEGLLAFNRIVAHDLRSPLKRIEAFLAILRQDYVKELDEEGKNIFDRIERASKRMRHMLDSLLEYARCGNFLDEGERVLLNNFIERAIDNFDFDLSNANIQVDLYTDSICSIKGNEDLLALVMQNLICNSIKFNDRDIPTIFITNQVLPNNMVEISVSDDGIGIDAQYAEKVFNIFSRLHNEDEYEGTGIGLAICKKIITDHTGTIHVDKTYHQGTRVVITLPLLISSNDLANQAVNS